jgi:competence protein ComEA
LLLLFAVFLCSCTRRVEYPFSTTSATSAGAVSLNDATIEELERLPGIGRKTAEAIEHHRREHGPFRRVEHLMMVPGVSERRFREIRPYLSL